MPKDRGCAGPGQADTVRQSASKCDIDARFRRRCHFSGRRAVGDEMPYTSGRGLMRSGARIGLPLVALSALPVSLTLSTNGSSRDTGVQLETGTSQSAHAGAAEQVVVEGYIPAPDSTEERGVGKEGDRSCKFRGAPFY